jgi:hypothetical protein
VLVLVVLLQPLVLLFNYLISSSLEVSRLLCNDHNFPLIGKVAYTKYTILEKYVFRKYINTWETCAGLGCVATASSSIIQLFDQLFTITGEVTL